jgi:hypothetical protein
MYDDYDADLLTYSDPSWGSLLVLRDVILEFPLCIAAAAVVPGIARVPRSPRAVSAPAANASAGMFQVTALWPGGKYCYLSAAAGPVCTFDGARYVSGEGLARVRLYRMQWHMSARGRQYDCTAVIMYEPILGSAA